MDIDTKLQLAIKHYQAGNLRQAELECKKILQIQPDNGQTLHLLGSIYCELGNYDLAIDYLKNALVSMPNNVDIYYDLGNVFQEKKGIDEALTYYQKVLQLNPNYIDAYNNIGIIYQDKGQLDEAIATYQKALQINGNIANINNNLGLTFQEKGRFDEAVIYFQRAIQLNPQYADAYYNLGNIFSEKSQFDEAVKFYKKAIQSNPDFTDVYFNLGNVFMELNELDDAVACYKKTIFYDRENIAAYLQLGELLSYQGKNDEAINIYDKILERKPNFFRARYARCMSHLLTIYPDQTSIQTSRNIYHEELIKLYETLSLGTQQKIEEAAEAVGTRQPFFLAYQESNDRELQQIYGNLVSTIMGLKYPQFSERLPMHLNVSGEPLRVGIVSGFFYGHTVWKLFKGWFQNLDQQRFSLYGYCTERCKDKETEVAGRCFSRFIDNILSFEELCKIIKEDNLHVIIYPEIGMDPVTVRLASLRLAPIQCASWGHPDTSGLPTIDYYISSELMEPPNADAHYTEKLIRLPNLSIYYAPLNVPLVETNRQILGLRPNSILYLCCQSLYKYLPQYDDIYPRIAQNVGDCQFAFISSHLSNWVTEQLHIRLKKVFNRFNLNADDYIIFLPRLNQEQYYAVNSLSDIYLDSIGWSGGNTTLEALSCNLPIVTFPNNLMRGRHSMAILKMMEVQETIAKSLDDYIEIAVKLGKDSEWRHQISDKIAANKHLVYRDRSCITALEDFLVAVVQEKFN